MFKLKTITAVKRAYTQSIIVIYFVVAFQDDISVRGFIIFLTNFSQICNFYYSATSTSLILLNYAFFGICDL